MIEKMPYYMAYPMPLSFDDERTERMDFEYLKSMYPEIPKRILPYIEEECDRMEYENSMIFDQYPDRLQVRLMCRRAGSNAALYEKDLDADAVEDLIGVMICQELYKRRCSHRRKCRKYY